jgi:hypothetical protein
MTAMGKLVLHNQRVWLGGYDLSGLINSLALERGVETRDAATLANNTRIQLPGLKTMAASLKGLWDTADGLDEELFNRVGLADAPMSYAASGAAEGDVAYSFLALLAEYSPGATIGDILEFASTAEAAGRDGLVRGTLMHNAQRTTSADGTARQLGAVADGQKLFGALHVTAGSGAAPTLDIIVESDSDSGMAGATTRMTFAQQIGVGFEWATPIAGPITDEWWRISWTLAGGSPDFEFIIPLAIQ